MTSFLIQLQMQVLSMPNFYNPTDVQIIIKVIMAYSALPLSKTKQQIISKLWE